LKLHKLVMLLILLLMLLFLVLLLLQAGMIVALKIDLTSTAARAVAVALAEVDNGGLLQATTATNKGLRALVDIMPFLVDVLAALAALAS
jgi:hypothetical protein